MCGEKRGGRKKGPPPQLGDLHCMAKEAAATNCKRDTDQKSEKNKEEVRNKNNWRKKERRRIRSENIGEVCVRELDSPWKNTCVQVRE